MVLTREEEIERLTKEQAQDDTYTIDPEVFVDLHLDAIPGDADYSTRNMTKHREWLLSCSIHGQAYTYFTHPGQRRCGECDRDSRRRSYHKMMRDPIRKAAERDRQRRYRAANREAYNARARERYRARKQRTVEGGKDAAVQQ